MTVTIKPLDDHDMALLAGQMREIDQFEFRVMSGGKPLRQVLDDVLKFAGPGRAAYFDGKLVAVYGVTAQTVLARDATPWMAATNEINSPKVRRAVVEHSKRELMDMAGPYSRLWNVVSEGNRVAIRWLKWMGFTFDGDVMIGPHRFLKFEMEA